jgi:hypothetical protein
MNNWNPLKVEWSKVCETREEFECFANFLKEMKGLAESRPHESEWDGRCRCGHLHSEHHSISSPNYSAGHCKIGECRCKHFMLESK